MPDIQSFIVEPESPLVMNEPGSVTFLNFTAALFVPRGSPPIANININQAFEPTGQYRDEYYFEIPVARDSYAAPGVYAERYTLYVTDVEGEEARTWINYDIIIEEPEGDTSAPTISSFTANDTTVSLLTSSQSQIVTFTVVASDNIGIDTISIPGATQTNVTGGTYTFTKTYSYANYSFGSTTDTLTVTVTDAAGNSVSNTLNITVTKSDDQSPSITSLSANDTTVSLLTSSQSQTVTFTAVVTDNVAIDTVTLSGATQTNVTGGTYTFTKTYGYASYSFGSATDTLTLAVTDTAGNSNTDTIAITVTKSDDQTPSITSLSANDTTVSLLTSSQSQTVTFTAVVTDNVAIDTVTLSGATQTNVTGGTYTFTKTYSYASYSFGSATDTLTLAVTDTTGNSNTDTIAISVTKSDDQSPSITSFSADDTTVTLSKLSTTQAVTFTVISTDNTGINSVTITGGTAPTPSLFSSSGNTYTFKKTYTVEYYAAGTTTDTLTVTVIDNYGNTNTGTLGITISKEDFTMLQPTYYIDITANINESIIENAGSYELPPSTIDKANPNYQTSYYLPSGQIILNSGAVTARNINQSNLGTYQSTITIDVNSNGQMIGVLEITGNDITQTITPDDPEKASVAYWLKENTTPTTITSNTADILSATLTTGEVQDLMQNEISLIESLYSGPVVVDWTAQLEGVFSAPSGPPNVIDQFALSNSRAYPLIFQEGEYIVLETKYDYEITIVDMMGTTRTIIPSTEIFARVTQDSSAPTL